jgi:8-oxo-dGTP diphosphatase
MPQVRQRLAAYGVCVRGERILLARFVAQDARKHWTLPGGKVEHGEDPYDAVVREVAEETGYAVAVDELLGVNSRRRVVPWGAPDGTDMQFVGLFYRVRITGGELRDEVGGSTDQAGWTDLAEVSTLERSVIIDIGLELDRTRPADGHIAPIEVAGLLRH